MTAEEVFISAYFESLKNHAPVLLMTLVFAGGLAVYLTHETTRAVFFGRWTPEWFVRIWGGLVVALCIIVCVTPLAFLLGFAAADAKDALFARFIFLGR
jgi:hypothetical protein